MKKRIWFWMVLFFALILNVGIVNALDESEDDKEPPVLLNIDIEKNVINLGESNTFLFKVSDNSNGIVDIDFKLSCEHPLDCAVYANTAINLNNNDTTAYEYINNNEYGRIDFENIILTDKYNNKSCYYIGSEPNEHDVNDSYCDRIEKYSDELYFEVINDKVEEDNTIDNEAPVLINVSVNKTKFNIPSASGEVELTASDNKKLKDSAVVKFSNGDNIITVLLDLQDDNKYRGNIFVDVDAELGKYKLSYVALSDNSGNSSYYNEDDLTTFDAGFELVSKSMDVIAKTSDENYLQIIRNAKDNDIIYLDSDDNNIIKKEVFEAIKGTNKTIHIKYNSIEWIFYGKDIKDENIKDISMSSMLNSPEYYEEMNLPKYNINKGLILCFANNGVLPGPVTIRLQFSYFLKNFIGKEFNVYYINKDDKQPLTKFMESSVKINEDGWYEFKLYHNSDYIMTNEPIDEKYIKVDIELPENNTEANEEITPTTISEDVTNKDEEIQSDVQNSDEASKPQQQVNTGTSVPVLGLSLSAVIAFIIIMIIRKKESKI